MTISQVEQLSKRGASESRTRNEVYAFATQRSCSRLGNPEWRVRTEIAARPVAHHLALCPAAR
jgi:hypothetical protein